MKLACLFASGRVRLLLVPRFVNPNVMHQNVSHAAVWIPLVVPSIAKNHHAHWFVQRPPVQRVRWTPAQSAMPSVESQFALWIARVLNHVAQYVRSHSVPMTARSLIPARSLNAVSSVTSQRPVKISRLQRSSHHLAQARQPWFPLTQVMRSFTQGKRPSSTRFQQVPAHQGAQLGE